MHVLADQPLCHFNIEGKKPGNKRQNRERKWPVLETLHGKDMRVLQFK